MADSYIIEVGSQAAGIVMRERHGFTFHAASDLFTPMDGQHFRSAREAEKAAALLANHGKQQVRQLADAAKPAGAAGFPVSRALPQGELAGA